MIRGICRPEVARRRAGISIVFAFSLIVSTQQLVGVLGAEPANGLPASQTPETVAELQELEVRVRNAIRSVLPAIVAVDVPPSRSAEGNRPRLNENHFERFASGVIIRSDGLIVSQWHVTHQLGLAVWRNPGDQGEVVLQDGRRLKAELLGADPVRDLSLLRIIEPGEYPSAPLAAQNSVSLGDWVLKLGHPIGYRANRGAVSRLGRILYLGDFVDIVADCLVSGGDSGGPLVNLDGQVVGIVQNSSSPQAIAGSDTRQRGVMPFCYMSVSTINQQMPLMLHPAQGKRPERGVDPTGLPGFQVFHQERFAELHGDRDLTILPVDSWTQGEKTRAAWQSLADQYSRSVVEVLRNELRVALGTIVSADGWILTKASEIPDAPRCRLANGETVPARVTGVDAAFDLAMLKIDKSGLQAVEWSKVADQSAVTFVAAPDESGKPIAVGIVSVPKRQLEGPFPAGVVKAPSRSPPAAWLPEVLVRPIADNRFHVILANGSAAKADIRPGDVLLTINGRPIRQRQDVTISMQGHAAGDELLVVIERSGRRCERTLTLDPEPYIQCPAARANLTNFRSDDFPIVFEHDIPLQLDECGSPVIGVDGKALGITIARTGQHGCMAIPAAAIEPLIVRLKGGNADTPK